MQTSHILESILRVNPGRRILPVLLVAALIIALPMAGCRKESPRPKKQVQDKRADESNGLFGSKESDSIKASFKGAQMTWADTKGRKVWDAKFKEAIASKADGDSAVELRGVEAGLYKEGKLSSNLVAPSVVADSRSKEIKASGGVELRSSDDGTLVKADRITWKSSEGKVYGIGNVKMMRKNLSVTASSFVADISLDKVKFTKGRLEVR